MSKFFSDEYSSDIPEPINVDKIVKGETGYAISLIDGKEVFDKSKDFVLPDEIEHIYPDYSIYPQYTKDTAAGFLTRGCPRGCNFCHVALKGGKRSVKVANLDEFWNGQKYIKLLDPNILDCKQHEYLLEQLIDSGTYVDFTQGLDIRLITERNAELLKKVRVKNIHFAWDNTKQDLSEKFRQFKEISGIDYRKLGVYVLTNFDSTLEEDLYRVYTLRDLGYSPYVMIYNKKHAQRKVKELQRWVNNRIIFNTVKRFEDYDVSMGI